MMKHSFILILLLGALVSHAQVDTSEKEQIRLAVFEYIEGRNNGDTSRLRNAFLPGANLKGVSKNKEQVISPLSEYISKQTPGRKHDCTTEVRFIDFVNEVAVAQVVIRYATHAYYDYLVLMKIKGKWMISDKIYTRKDAQAQLP